MRSLSLLLVLICSTAFAQLEVTVKKAKSVITAQTVEVMRLETEDGIAIGREVVRELDPVVRPGQPAAIIIVKPDRPADQIELIKLKCETAEVHPIADAPGYFGISKPGKHSVSVNVFGKDPFTWDDKTILVEVGQGPNPPPVPPGPGPGPDDGSFDNLADRANVIAQQITDAEKNQIAGLLITAADKMQAFEFRQVKQATEYIARNWPSSASPGCAELFKMVATDAAGRVLSWQETQAYYRILAGGVIR